MKNETVVAVPLDWLKLDKVERRERIATACLVSVLSNPTTKQIGGGPIRAEQASAVAEFAVGFADALIEELDK